MQLVDNDTFLKQLAALFESSKSQGSIWLTHKRLTHDDDVNMEPEGQSEDTEYPCLVRLTDGGEVKFSTRVTSAQLPAFHREYGALLKASMSTLRKRDKKREKQRAEQVAFKKKRLNEPVIVNGPKRGNGRKKRQRQMKAAVKQQEALQLAKDREEAKSKATEGSHS
ncbi:signal recognition particle 14 kda [Moniliophthora roreri MCA 2997]|uniref:Signal recognition particle subunit SRP14 n=2 Tax=Moniliophthora roreri TaxID=221103 RepID=V2WNI8_MONRO|nr:signal recognition particle 14 kda [Moniliophthora roreri MCA 2997]KAI3610710.1 signal recognition particle 14 kda [Moniliophthora roreri]